MAAKNVEHSFVVHRRLSTFLCLTSFVICAFVFLSPAQIIALGDNSYLSELSVEDMDLYPAFRKTTLAYQVEVPESTTQLEIVALPEDERAQVEIVGNEDLRAGRNAIQIIVTAEDESTTSYELVVLKAGAVEAIDVTLRLLSIPDYMLTPQFRNDLFEYSIQVSHDVDSLEIIAIPNNPNSTISIEGNTDLKAGENQISITVVSENGDVKETYFIQVHKSEEPDLSGYQRDVRNQTIISYAPWAGGVLVAIALMAIIALRIKKKSGKEAEYDEDL